MPECPDPEEELRQGDLLAHVRLPKVKLPLDILSAEGKKPGSTANALLPATVRSYLVVSQCCTIENHGAVAVAPVVSTKPLNDGEEAPYLADHPPGPADAPTGYVFNAHALEPVDGTLPERQRQLWIADLTQTISVDGDRAILQAARVARMTTVARLALRTRLASFWGRAVADDLRELN